MNTTINKDIHPNEQQQLCIDNINGKYMVLAGPGTGKTFTLTNRIKSMINDHSVSPSEILCLTYSDAAALEMKSRIVGILGNIAINIQISTYHGFCGSIIQNYPEKFNFDTKIKLIDKVSKNMIAKKILDEANGKNIDLTSLKDKWGNYYKAEDTIIDAVSYIKRSHMTKEQFLSNLKTNEEWYPLLSEYKSKRENAIAKNRGTKTIDEKIEKQINKIEKAKIVWELAQSYRELMYKNNYIDFDDMVSSVAEVTKDDEELGYRVFSKYKYILVDEYQDTNQIQNELLDIIIYYSEGKNIFVVGDDDQIIYGFQGASTDNCENFLRKYPETKVICLVENNRSTQNILDFAYEVISQDERRLENNTEFTDYGITKKLTAKNPLLNKINKKIEYRIYSENTEENNGIADKIQEIIKDMPKGGKLSDIAVLGRTNSQIEELSRLLSGMGIVCQTNSEKNIFETQSGLILYFYLKILNSRKYSIDKQFQILMSEPFKIEEEDYLFLMSKNRPIKRDFITLIEENTDYKWKNPDRIKNFINTYQKLQELKYTKTLHNFIIHVANESGILSYYANSKINTEENILAIKRIIAEAAAYREIYIRSYNNEEIKPGPYLSDFLEYLDKCIKSEAVPELEKSGDVNNAVQLLTYHGAKGREFGYVFLPWLSAKSFESKRNKNDFKLPTKAHVPSDKEKDLKSELLKLIFVGITRAKHDLYLSFSLAKNNKPEELTELLSEKLTNNPLVETHNIPAQGQIISTYKSIRAGLFNGYEKELSERVKNIELSAHSFETYKRCPKQYLYKEVYALPVEDEDTLILDYGNAVHYAFQKLVKNAQDRGYYISLKETISFFTEKLNQFEYTDETEYEKWKSRGIKAIEGYYHHITEIPIKNIYCAEYRFSGVPYGKMTLKGFIDYIEENDDGTYSIYDYKTGSAKSKKSICKNGEYDNYYCQLAFYKIAFEKNNPTVKVRNTGIKFVEERKNVDINFTQEEIDVVEKEMKEVTERITSLNFEVNNEQDKKTCERCKYKLICRI